MDKFFLALIGVFLGIFAYLKIQLSFSKKKAQKALSEAAKNNAEKESIESYASVAEALSKKLDAIQNLGSIDAGSIVPTEINENPAEASNPSDTPLGKEASALSDSENLLSAQTQTLSHEQLTRLRQLKGL